MTLFWKILVLRKGCWYVTRQEQKNLEKLVLTENFESDREIKKPIHDGLIRLNLSNCDPDI